MGVQENTVHLLAGQKRLKDEYKNPDVLPKINKTDMAGSMESVKEYIRSCCGVMRAPFAYMDRKTITVQTYGNYPKYAPNNEMIANLCPDKNKLHNEQHAQ